MPLLTIDLTDLGLPIADASGWVQAVDSLGNPMPIVASAGAMLFGSRALDFDTAGVATINIPSTDDLEPAGIRYLVFLTRTDTTTQPVAVGPFLFTVDAALGAVAELPPADVAAAITASVAAAQDILDALEPVDAIADRVDGYTNHGAVSGAVTFSGPTGSHWFTATGPATITLDGYAEGQVASLLCFSGAENVNVVGLPDLELTDGVIVAMQLALGAWYGGGGGGVATGTPDTTPPTAVTDLTATGSEAQIVLAWSAATDAESSVSYGYKVWKVGDTEPGTYTTRTTPGVTVTGLAAGNYNAKVYSFSSGGSTVADTATATVTAAANGDPYAVAVLADNPLAFWRLNETTGTQATDQSGNAHHGTYSGAYTRGATGLNGGAASTFTGGKVTVPSGAWIPLTGYTIEGWMKSTNTSGNPTIASRDESFILRMDSGFARVFTFDGPGSYTFQDGGFLTPDQWHYVVATVTSGGSMKVYGAGALIGGPTAGRVTPANPGTVLEIASNAVNSVFQDVAIYSGILSDARIAAHYAAATGN